MNEKFSGKNMSVRPFLSPPLQDSSIRESPLEHVHRRVSKGGVGGQSRFSERFGDVRPRGPGDRRVLIRCDEGEAFLAWSWFREGKGQCVRTAQTLTTPTVPLLKARVSMGKALATGNTSLEENPHFEWQTAARTRMLLLSQNTLSLPLSHSVSAD